jgi:hypothetical protein
MNEVDNEITGRLLLLKIVSNSKMQIQIVTSILQRKLKTYHENPS